MTTTKRIITGAVAAAVVATSLAVLSTSPASADDTTLPNEAYAMALATASPSASPTASQTEAPSTNAPVRSKSINTKRVFSSRSRQAVAIVRSLAPSHYLGYFRTSKYAKWYASRHIKHLYGWGPKQFKCMRNLWQKESSWRPAAVGARHRFFGIPQLSKFAIVASGHTVAEFRSSTELQIQLGSKYIKYRKGYGSPCKALNHFKRKHWY